MVEDLKEDSVAGMCSSNWPLKPFRACGMGEVRRWLARLDLDDVFDGVRMDAIDLASLR